MTSPKGAQPESATPPAAEIVDAETMYERASDAQERGRLPAARTWFSRMRRDFPLDDRGFVGSLQVCAPEERASKAALMLRQAERKVPGTGRPDAATRKRWANLKLDPSYTADGVLALAILPVRGTKPHALHWEESLRRLETARRLFPEDGRIADALLEALRENGRLDDALALGAELVAAGNPTREVLRAHAETALAVGDPAATLSATAELAARGEDTVELAALRIAALAELGRFPEGEAVAADALTRFPPDYTLLSAVIRLTAAASGWDDAQARLEAMRGQGVPGPLLNRLQRVVTRQREAATEAATDADSPEAKFFGGFESLGAQGAWGCEFGVVQRRFGSENMGLLRWTSITADRLVEALNADFAGVGEPDQIELRGRGGNYDIVDTRFRIAMHTFTKVNDLPREKMAVQAQRRFSFLRSKMLEDLRSGDKILVYKLGPANARREIQSLFDAVRRHGPSPLLCVALASEPAQAGTIETIAPGLYLGFVNFFVRPEVGQVHPDFAAWRAICEATARACGRLS